MDKKIKRELFEEAVRAWKTLDESGLLCSTDSTMILDRIKYKYKLSPIKFLQEK